MADWRGHPGTTGVDGGSMGAKPPAARRLERLADARGDRKPPQASNGYVLPPRGPGAFRKEFINPVKSDRIGVAILAYQGLADVQANAPTVVEHAKPNYDLFLFDNSETDTIGKWLKARCPRFAYERSPENVGCANGRNRILEWSASRGHQWLLIQDQDVRWVGDAAGAMLAVARNYPDTGCVTWQLAIKQMGNHRWDKTGKLTPPECPGMACLYSVEALTAGDDPGLVGWCPEFFMYRFDTACCFALWKKGYAIRVVTEGPNLVRHDHPHLGVRRYPFWREEQARSLGIFAELSRKYGFPRLG